MMKYGDILEMGMSANDTFEKINLRTDILTEKVLT